MSGGGSSEPSGAATAAFTAPTMLQPQPAAPATVSALPPSFGQFLLGVDSGLARHCDALDRVSAKMVCHLTDAHLAEMGVNPIDRLLICSRLNDFEVLGRAPACVPGVCQRMSQNEFMEEMVKGVGEQLVLDKSRRDFVEDTAMTLHRLVCRNININQKGAPAYRRLLMGRKGVGKTALLATIQEVAQKLCGSTLVCVYASLEQVPNRVPVLQLVRTALQKHHGLHLPVSITLIEELVEWLHAQQRVLFLMLDEMQIIFEAAFGSAEQARLALGEVSGVGSSSGFRIHCVLSGSSTWLRRLCFKQMPLDHDKISSAAPTAQLLAGFPHYSVSTDLNSTKFSACWIHPFADPEHFRALYSYLKPMHPHPHLSMDETDMYLRTGGNARLLQRLFETAQVDVWSIGLRHLAEKSVEMRVLRDLHKAVSMRLPSQAVDDLSWCAAYTTSVPASSLQRADDSIDLHTLTTTLYNLADAGYVSYLPAWNASPSDARVGLVSAALYVCLFAQQGFSQHDYWAILHPSEPCDKRAELVVLKCLASSQQTLLAPRLNAERSVRTLQLPNADESAGAAGASSPSDSPAAECNSPFPPPERPALVQYATSSLSELCEHVFKETYGFKQADTLGADAVLFEQDPKGQLVAHRVQIKLGVGPKKQSWATDAAKKFRTRLPEAQRAYGEHVKLRHYLLTTRQLWSETRDEMQKIVVADTKLPILDAVFSARDLKDMLWPDDIKMLF